MELTDNDKLSPNNAVIFPYEFFKGTQVQYSGRTLMDSS